MVITSPGDEEESATSPTSPQTSAEGYLPGNDDAEAVEAEALTEAPDDTDWALVGNIMLPYSEEAGPHEDNGVTASLYERTPEGALLAAAHLSSRAGGYTPREMWEQTIEHQFVDSEDREALLDLMHEEVGDQEFTAGDVAEMAGFTYRSYDPDEAVIEVVLDTRQGAWYSVLVTVEWVAGDWRMVAPPAGDWMSMMRHLDSADHDSVIRWGPQ